VGRADLFAPGPVGPVSAAQEQGLKRKSPPQIRLQQIREITQFLSRPPLEAPRAVVVIEAANTMAEAAANGLLKTLEEPGQATIILLAPGSHALLPTLVSRCQTVPFSRLSTTDMTAVLQQVEQSEVLQHPQIVAMAQGSPGQAIHAYRQLQEIPPDLLQALQNPPTTLRDALDRGGRLPKPWILKPNCGCWTIFSSGTGTAYAQGVSPGYPI
jgi:DNA polymerase-3 subunit delta'